MLFEIFEKMDRNEQQERKVLIAKLAIFLLLVIMIISLTIVSQAG